VQWKPCVQTFLQWQEWSFHQDTTDYDHG
jgi:hypothetical protein